MSEAGVLSDAGARPILKAADVFGHPRGLVALAGTELWERVSFHGMQALLTLYMAEQLLLPGRVERVVGFAGFRAALEAVTGPLSTQALAAQIFGLYVGFVYFTPVFGGLLGDRLLGRTNAVALGAVLMTAGHFCMAFDQSFLAALLLLILGAGLLRGNLLSQVGHLYAPEDRRRADGFQIYYSMVNVGAFMAPLITGTLQQTYGWHVGFGFAGFGMLGGLAIYLFGRRHVPRDASRETRHTAAALTDAERRVVRMLVLLLPLLTMFWVAQSQIWNVYNLWARDHVDLVVGGWQMPVPWLQSIDGVASFGMVPVVLWGWRRLATSGREPDDFGKLGWGCLMFGAAIVWLAAGHLVFAGRLPLLWAVTFHFLAAFGYLHVQPVAIGFYAKTAPPSVNAMMIGVYFLSIFAGSTISGRLGGLYERLSPAAYWLLHAAIVGAAGLLLLAFARLLRRQLPTPA